MVSGRFSLAVALSSLTLSACGGSGYDQGSAPTPARDALGCVTGTWTAGGTGDPVQYESGHFAFRWTGNATSVDAAKSLSEGLEQTYKFYAETIRFRQPECDSDSKKKINVNVSAALTNIEMAGIRDGIGFIDATAGTISFTDQHAHELAHVFQAQTPGWTTFPSSFYETHANWMVAQIPQFRENLGCSDEFVNNPHLYLGNARTRYCSWMFLEYLKDTKGVGAINDLWTKAVSGNDQFAELLRQQGWSLAQLNDQIATFAMRNIGWDYVDPDGYDRGAYLRASYGRYQTDDKINGRERRVTFVEPIDAAKRRFAVPFAWAPQRWGYNVVQLVPDAGSTSITVDFRGIGQAGSGSLTSSGTAASPTS